MKMLMNFITWGVTALPLKRNLIPRFVEGERLQRRTEHIRLIHTFEALITIHDTKLSHILIGPGAELNVMSLHTFEALQILISGLCLAHLIHGFGYGLIEQYNIISLPVIFSEVDSFPLEHVLFNVLDFDLTYDCLRS
jgi:hypothetical protein